MNLGQRLSSKCILASISGSLPGPQLATAQASGAAVRCASAQTLPWEQPRLYSSAQSRELHHAGLLPRCGQGVRVEVNKLQN